MGRDEKRSKRPRSRSRSRRRSDSRDKRAKDRSRSRRRHRSSDRYDAPSSSKSSRPEGGHSSSSSKPSEAVIPPPPVASKKSSSKPDVLSKFVSVDVEEYFPPASSEPLPPPPPPPPLVSAESLLALLGLPGGSSSPGMPAAPPSSPFLAAPGTGIEYRTEPPPPPPASSSENAENLAPPPPAVDDNFVPSIPKHLLHLVVPGSGGQLVVGNSGVMIASGGQPPEVAKRLRESRRAHISGFPPGTPKQELVTYFMNIMHGIRRTMVLREVNAVIDEENQTRPANDKLPYKEFPPSATIEIDRILDSVMDTGKSKPFAFIEFTHSDIVTEMVEMWQANRDAFPFYNTMLQIRRPKDYAKAVFVDRYKVVVMGVPPNVGESRFKQVLEGYGEIENYQVKDKYHYAEFIELQDAIDCVKELNGEVLRGRILLVQHVTEVSRPILMQAGISLSEPKADAAPEEIAAVHQKIQEKHAEAAMDFTRDALDFSCLLPNVICRFIDKFPHLEPAIGAGVRVFPTRILVLLNMFDEQELLLEEDFARLEADIAEEVELYGRVKRLIIPRRLAPPVAPKVWQPKPYEPPSAEDIASATPSVSRTVEVLELQNPFDTSDDANTTASTTTKSDALREDKFELPDGTFTTDAHYAAHMKEQKLAEEAYQRSKEEFHKQREKWQQDLIHPVFGGVGRVFVEYETVDEAAFAQSNIAGKLFSNRTVVTSFLFEDVLYPPSAEEEAAEEARKADEALKAYLDKTVRKGGEEEPLAITMMTTSGENGVEGEPGSSNNLNGHEEAAASKGPTTTAATTAVDENQMLDDFLGDIGID